MEFFFRSLTVVPYYDNTYSWTCARGCWGGKINKNSSPLLHPAAGPTVHTLHRSVGILSSSVVFPALGLISNPRPALHSLYLSRLVWWDGLLEPVAFNLDFLPEFSWRQHRAAGFALCLACAGFKSATHSWEDSVGRMPRVHHGAPLCCYLLVTVKNGKMMKIHTHTHTHTNTHTYFGRSTLPTMCERWKDFAQQQQPRSIILTGDPKRIGLA